MQRFVVSESSGCLDVSEATEKYSLERSHFNMNKFCKPNEEDFKTASEVMPGTLEVYVNSLVYVCFADNMLSSNACHTQIKTSTMSLLAIHRLHTRYCSSTSANIVYSREA